MAYEIYQDDSCFAKTDCRVEACKAKISFGPTSALEDISAPKWWLFSEFVDLLSFDLDQNVDTEEFLVIGDCDPRLKATTVRSTIAGSLYFCKNDIAACRACRIKNCVSYCIIECGEGYTSDTDLSNPDPMYPDTPVFGDPIGAGDTVTLGVALIDSCGKNFTPGDYVKQSFSGKGIGKVYEFNYCIDLENFDDDAPDPGTVVPIPYMKNDAGLYVPNRMAA